MSDSPVEPSSARPSKKATLRLDQRILTRISYTFVILFLFILIPTGYKVYLNFKSQRDLTIGKTNLLNVYKALATYAQDWDGRLPPADRWTELIAGYLHAPPNTPGGAMSYLKGPGDGEDVGYVYNDLAAGYNLESTPKNDNKYLSSDVAGSQAKPDSKEESKKEIAPGDLVVLIEKAGAKMNEHIVIPLQVGEGTEKLGKLLDFPHFASDEKKATSMVVLANGRIEQRMRQDFQH